MLTGSAPDAGRQGEPAGLHVHREDAARAGGAGRLHAEEADGTTPHDRHRAAGLDLGDRRGEDARGQDVPDEQRALVVHVVRDVQEIHVGDGDAHVRGLRAGQVAAERARAEVPEVVA